MDSKRVAALRQPWFCGGGSLRRQLIATALVASAAAVLLLSFAAPFSFSSSAASLTFEEGLMTTSSPPRALSISSGSESSDPVSNATILLTPSAVPSPAPFPDSDDTDVDYGSPDSKVAPLWKEVSDSDMIRPFLDAGPSPVVSSDAAEVNFGGDEPERRPEIAMVASTPTDQQLTYAKREIEHAPVVFGDPELYPPIFRNVSVFKRSYELMEKILKVYVYQDGSKPIFHRPELKGIYASEGWFMKLMEENKKFVVKDPSKAHLFYMPYSVLRLQQALYVPDSHNMEPLMIFLRNYIQIISAKYPFWNRTRGADHFIVACHDWGPYTTKQHNELRKNTIKALCNADTSEGIFVRGKDVSLPETSIRVARRPLRNIGGKPASQRIILAFFSGQMHGRIRPILLQHWRGKDEDMKIYGPLPNRVSRKMSYIEHMKSSKFCICPMGYEVNSPRIVEAIYYECVPVIIADNFVLPFEEVLDWGAFSVVVPEKDIANLKDILLRIPQRQYITMQMNIKRLQKHFLWHAKPVKYDIFHMILHSIWFSRLNQIQIQQ